MSKKPVLTVIILSAAVLFASVIASEETFDLALHEVNQNTLSKLPV